MKNSPQKVLLFGGTTEGRVLAEYLSHHKIHTHVCVASQYGEKLLPESEYITSSGKRLDEEEITCLLTEYNFDIVVDATHPFAVAVSGNIKRGCERTDTPYIRILREENEKISGIWVQNVKEAAEYLSQTKGNILITTGSNELKEYTRIEGYENRCYPRMLCSLPVIEKAKELGFLEKNMICMQGPFTAELNTALLKQINASYLVTKESGAPGGFYEKIESAVLCGVTPVIIGRPKEEEGLSLDMAKKFLLSRYGVEEKQRITLLGIGMGDYSNLTIEGIEALNNCQLLIGSKRVLETLESFKKKIFATTSNEEIISCIKGHKECEHIVVAFSGDIGFFSGAKRLRPYLMEYEVKSISGLSSPVYFLGKLGVSWEDTALVSLHGRDNNLIKAVREHEKVFALLGGVHTVHSVCKTLLEHELLVHIYVGENLSYSYENIRHGTPKELLSMEFDTMAVMYIENKQPLSVCEKVTYGIEDEAFIRGKTPMTKSEVRSISLSKLQLTKESIIYDVGAGTGSVAIEAALLAKEGLVYAIEKKEDAVSLIQRNQEKFKVTNMKIIQGEAPKILEQLPPPTHVFIGGTSGALGEILSVIFKKNPQARIVINLISLESIGETMKVLKEISITDLDIVQATIAKGKEAGRYHLMTGQNPVYIISFTGC